MARRVIVLLGNPIITEEGAAGEAIKPGHIVKGVSTILKQTGATTTPVPRNVALERDEIGDDIDVAYATNDYVKVAHFAPGDRAYCFIPSGQVIVADDLLESDGAGRLIKRSSGIAWGRALEASSPTADTRIRVELM
jgi:hypothetical protein